MNMSVPGTVNVKVSKKHTVDRQKIFRITISSHKGWVPQLLQVHLS